MVATHCNVEYTCISGAVLGNSGYSLLPESSATHFRGCRLKGEDSCSGSANTAGSLPQFFTASSQSCITEPSRLGSDGYKAGALGLSNWDAAKSCKSFSGSKVCCATLSSVPGASIQLSSSASLFDSVWWVVSFGATADNCCRVAVKSDVQVGTEEVCCISAGSLDGCAAVLELWTGFSCSSWVSSGWGGEEGGKLRGISVKSEPEASWQRAAGASALLFPSACFCFRTFWEQKQSDRKLTLLYKPLNVSTFKAPIIRTYISRMH